MKTLLMLITISQLCHASFKASQCSQWCKDFPDMNYDDGEWNEKKETCRCYHDYDRHSMGMMKMPFTIKKAPPDNSSSL